MLADEVVRVNAMLQTFQMGAARIQPETEPAAQNTNTEPAPVRSVRSAPAFDGNAAVADDTWDEF